MAKKNNSTLLQIADYYSDKIKQFGNTPAGVDWNGEEGQTIRFQQLCKILPKETKTAFSINDLGCGYTALNSFLTTQYTNFKYNGYDLSEEMVTAAKNITKQDKNVHIKCASHADKAADYGIASGIFNVKLNEKHDVWTEHIIETLKHLNRSSIKGFAFNCLTSYSDEGKMKNYLYYANPNTFFDLCKKEFSRNIALLHDYDLYEFTILVRK